MQSRFASRFATGLALGTLAMGLLVTAPSASAQTGPLTADIPFAFESGHQHFTAGRYKVALESSHMTAIENTATHQSEMFFTIPEQAPQPSASGKLVFRRYGSRYFLREVWTQGNSLGRTLTKSRAEREVQLASASTTQPTVTLALNQVPR